MKYRFHTCDVFTRDRFGGNQLAVLPDALTRKAFEIDVARIMVDKGYNAVPASNIKGMSGGITGTGGAASADCNGLPTSLAP